MVKNLQKLSYPAIENETFETYAKIEIVLESSYKPSG